MDVEYKKDVEIFVVLFCMVKAIKQTVRKTKNKELNGNGKRQILF